MKLHDLCREPLALLGGPKAVPVEDPLLFHWPIVTPEDEGAVLAVLRDGTMSASNISREFEKEFAAWLGVKNALSYCNGTMALLAAMHAVGIRRGDEIICPSITYWASALPVFALGGSVVFADVLPDTLCLDPVDLDRRITPQTRAVVVVHYCGHPADMDAIMAIARRRRLKVIEDVSHAHGTLYKGRMTGTFGEVSAMSMMSGKAFPIGEAGMLVTDQPEIYQRAAAFSHYERHGELTLPDLKPLAGLPLGGVKGRLNQTCAAMGRVQLKYYPQRMKAIQDALNRFWDLLEGTPGLKAHRPSLNSGSTMGGWYNPIGIYAAEELGGLPVDRFIEAVNAEGGRSGRGINSPLHLHPVFNEADIYGDGKPTRNAFSSVDLRQPAGSLPMAENAANRAFGIPYFKHDQPEAITRFAAAFRKVALQADTLIKC